MRSLIRTHDTRYSNKSLHNYSCSKTCGKIIIVGEHAVVHGSEAVAIPLANHNLFIEARISNKEDFNKQTHKIKKIINDTFQYLNLQQLPISIKIKSQIKEGSGLGSSASLCIGIIKTVTKLMNIHINKNTICAIANKLERNFHDNPSGIDTSVISHETPIVFKRPCVSKSFKIKKIKSKKRNYSWPFMLINSNICTPTWKMVQKATPYFQSLIGKNAVHLTNEISKQTVEGFSSGSLIQVSRSMTEFSKILEDCGVVSPTLKHMIIRSRQLGALSAKPTGGGGGGFVLTLLDPHRQEEQVLLFEKEFGNRNVQLILL